MNYIAFFLDKNEDLYCLYKMKTKCNCHCKNILYLNEKLPVFKLCTFPHITFFEPIILDNTKNTDKIFNLMYHPNLSKTLIYKETTG